MTCQLWPALKEGAPYKTSVSLVRPRRDLLLTVLSFLRKGPCESLLFRRQYCYTVFIGSLALCFALVFPSAEPDRFLQLSDVLCPNETELALLCKGDVDPENDESVCKGARELIERGINA